MRFDGSEIPRVILNFREGKSGLWPIVCWYVADDFMFLYFSWGPLTIDFDSNRPGVRVRVDSLTFWLGVPKRMRWFRRWYHSRTGMWMWGIIVFIQDDPVRFPKVIMKDHLTKEKFERFLHGLKH